MGSSDIDSLRLLVLVGRLGGIGHAATAAGIAQPSASNRLAALERAVGVSLLNRDRRGATLTEAGSVVVGWATPVLDDLETLHAKLATLRAGEAQLDIGASMTLAEYLLPGWIGALRQRAPGLRVGLQVTNSAQVVDLVRRDTVGIGFVETPGAPPGLSSRRVAADRLVVVVPPEHPWAVRSEPLGPGELAAAAMVGRESGSGTRRTVDAALLRAGAAPRRPALELGSATAVRNAVLAGAGPAVMSEFAVAADVAAHRLAAVAVSGIDLRRVLRAVWPGGRRLTGPAALLLSVAIGQSE